MIEETNKNKRKVLVIEDNELYSEGLSYVLNENNFEVISVFSTDEAYQKLFDIMPDIVIFDVVLNHKVDGFSFLNIMKADLRVAHIPVFIISSVALHDKLYQALSIGASDFLIKPFNVEHLIIRINSVLKLSDNITRFVESKSVLPFISEKDVHHKIITDFTLHVQSIINDNKDCSIPDIVRILGIGYSKLEEIIRRVFNVSPVTYILSKRLEKADLMLRNSNMSINDIAYSSGFHSASYFCTCYKKHFGITPLQNRKNSFQRQSSI